MDPSPSSSSQSPSPLAAPAKIFVGGITKELEEEALKEYFEKYGDVKEIVVVKERATGNVKGYGFVEFVDAEAAERAINDEGRHLIRARSVEVKRAKSRSNQSTNHTNNDNNITPRKIFVGGLPSNITEKEFKRYFEKFGSVNDAVIMIDTETRRPRGFGFVTFEAEEAAKNALQKRFHELNKKIVEVKIAIPKDNHHISNIANSQRPISCVNYSPYGPENGNYYGFGPVWYSYEGYSAINYVAPMFTWNEQAMMTVRQISVPGFYPGCGNIGYNGYMEMDNGGGYYGGKLNQNGRNYMAMKEIANKGYFEVENVKVDDAAE